MLSWLIGVVVFVLLWGALWKSSPRAALGAVFGFVVALVLYWIFSPQLKGYVTGMNEIPIWLPPLPIAIIVIALFYFGVKTWLNADNLPPPPQQKEPDDGHGHGGGHGHH
jgi:ABC-type sulfate transport system permease component